MMKKMTISDQLSFLTAILGFFGKWDAQAELGGGQKP